MLHSYLTLILSLSELTIIKSASAHIHINIVMFPSALVPSSVDLPIGRSLLYRPCPFPASFPFRRPLQQLLQGFSF